MQKHYSNIYAEFWIEDHILYVIFKPNTILNLQGAKKIVADRLQFQQSREYAVYCDTRGLLKVDYDARIYLTKEGVWGIIAIAFIVEEHRTETFARYYKISRKFGIPIRIFRDPTEEKAYIHQL